MNAPRSSSATGTVTYQKFRQDIAENFHRVVEGIDGTVSSRCGDLRIRRENGSVHLSAAAARLIADILGRAQLQAAVIKAARDILNVRDDNELEDCFVALDLAIDRLDATSTVTSTERPAPASYNHGKATGVE